MRRWRVSRSHCTEAWCVRLLRAQCDAGTTSTPDALRRAERQGTTGCLPSFFNPLFLPYPLYALS